MLNIIGSILWKNGLFYKDILLILKNLSLYAQVALKEMNLLWKLSDWLISPLFVLSIYFSNEMHRGRRGQTTWIYRAAGEVCCTADPLMCPLVLLLNLTWQGVEGKIVLCHDQFPFSPPLTVVCLPPPRQPPWDGHCCLRMLPACISSLAGGFKSVSPSVRQNSWTQRRETSIWMPFQDFLFIYFFYRFTCGCHDNRWTTERVNTGETLYPLGTTYGQETFSMHVVAFTPWIKRSGVISWPECELLLLIWGKS